MYVSLRIGLSVMELYGTEFLVSCTFQHKCYVSILLLKLIIVCVTCMWQWSHVHIKNLTFVSEVLLEITIVLCLVQL